MYRQQIVIKNQPVLLRIYTDIESVGLDNWNGYLVAIDRVCRINGANVTIGFAYGNSIASAITKLRLILEQSIDNRSNIMREGGWVIINTRL